MTSIYIIYYAGIKPTLSKQQQRLICLNEVIIMMNNYHLFCFTWFTDINIQYSIGASITYIILAIIAINFAVMSYNVVTRCRVFIKKR